MDERIGLLESLYTNRAIRRFRPDPIPDLVISKVIEAATQAPNGSNRQRWRFMVIRDPDLRRRVGEVYRRAMDELLRRRMLLTGEVYRVPRPRRVRVSKVSCKKSDPVHAQPQAVLPSHPMGMTQLATSHVAEQRAS